MGRLIITGSDASLQTFTRKTVATRLAMSDAFVASSRPPRSLQGEAESIHRPDNVAVEFVSGPGPRPIPEPTTLALLGLGLASLAVARRRKQ